MAASPTLPHSECLTADVSIVETMRHSETEASSFVPRSLNKMSVTSADDIRIVAAGSRTCTGCDHYRTKTFLSVAAVNGRSSAATSTHKLSAPTPVVRTTGRNDFSGGTHGDSAAHDRHKVC